MTVQISKGTKGTDGSLQIVETRTIDPSHCPSFRLDADHYRADGSCRCDEIASKQRAEQASRERHLGLTELAIQLCEKYVRNGYVRFANEYGEPGYRQDQPKKGILFADWNDAPKWLVPGLERRGFAIEWEDEWIETERTGKAYRSKPDSYSWTPYYVTGTDGGIIGGDEIEEDAQTRDWYVNGYLLNDPDKANLFGIDLTELGFTQVEREFASGWYPGQDDNPRKVFEALRRDNPKVDVVFSVDSQGQFDTHWSAWTRTAEEHANGPASTR